MSITPSPRAIILNEARIADDLFSRKPHLARQLDDFIVSLKRRVTKSSYKLSRQTAELIRSVIGVQRWGDSKVLLSTLRAIGRRLVKALPYELSIGNIVLRILFIVREEFAQAQNEADEQGLLNDDDADTDDNIDDTKQDEDTYNANALVGWAAHNDHLSIASAGGLVRSSSRNNVGVLASLSVQPSLSNIMDDRRSDGFVVSDKTDMRHSIIEGVNVR